MSASRLASRFLTLALLGTLAAGLAGCAAGTLPPVGPTAAPVPSLAPADLLSQAAEAARTSTAPVDIVITMSGRISSSASAEPVTLDGTTVSMSFQAQPLMMLVKLHVPVAGAGTTDMELRVVDGVMYFSMPGALAGWYSMSLDELTGLSEAAGSGATGLGAQPSIDPKVLADLLQGDGLRIEYGAPEQLDGRAMRVVTITATKAWIERVLTTALDASGGTTSLPMSMDELKAALPAEIPMSLWIDAETSLLRRFTISIAPGGDQRLDLTVDIRAHDGPLQVAAPPAGEVKSFTDMFGGSLPGLPLESLAP